MGKDMTFMRLLWGNIWYSLSKYQQVGLRLSKVQNWDNENYQRHTGGSGKKKSKVF